MNMSFGTVALLLFLAMVSSSDGIHVSVMNRLGSGKVVSLHCRSGDNDLGDQSVADGSEFSWDFDNNIWGTTLFFCDLGLNQGAETFQFVSYDFGRDFVRCKNQCLWLVSGEGMYGLNDQTGFWEFMYQWST
ncbi:hypothetical protein QQ045_010333 [Rhodiola kirilowii]